MDQGHACREGRLDLVRRSQIRVLVERLLEQAGVSDSPIPVAEIATALGADVRFEPAPDDLSGFLYRDRSGGRAIVGVNGNHPRNRQRFTIAHELGHFLLHNYSGDVHVDREFRVWLRSHASASGVDENEREANLFAAELLMPARFLAHDVPRLSASHIPGGDVIGKLAEHYGVSTQAMTLRLAYLRYIEQ